MTPLHVRRAYFDNYADTADASPGRYGRRFTCPCCGYPTLRGRSAYEICFLCGWEDDGQDDPNADENFGGPNHGFTLVRARGNFERYLVMYEPNSDTSVGGSDTPAENEAKTQAIVALERLLQSPESEHPQLWERVRSAERELHQLLKQRIRRFENGG
jgi:hypothetical protein